jgi:hypothetical protein
MDYVRIGTTYYKKVRKPLVSGDTVENMMAWSVECIKQDHGKHFLSSIPRFDGFCLVPSHLEYRREIANFYNRYHPFLHQPIPGYPKQTLNFLKHVFGEQLDIGLDYLKIMLMYPTQVLPILCLVSTERNTGKTTFLNFLKALFGDNMTINRNEDFRSNFNSEWASKLIIGVDETLLDRKEDSERIKSLSTSKYYKVESKGFDRQEIEFFGKFVFCSNNEVNFIMMDLEEIRYWVRRLKVLENENNKMLSELTLELPVFVHYLMERPFTTEHTTRMWFRPDQLMTSALKKIKRFNRNKLDVEMSQLLLSILDSRDFITEISFTLSDMQDWLAKKGFRHDSSTIRTVLQTTWQLKPVPNSLTYLQYKFGIDGVYEFNSKGRFYTVTKKLVLSLNNLDEFDAEAINTC